MRGFSLPNRNATTWNILPSEVVNAGTVNFFKSKLDTTLAHHPCATANTTTTTTIINT